MAFMQKIKRGWMMGLIAYEYILDHKTTLLFTTFAALLQCTAVLTFISLLLTKTGLIKNIAAQLNHRHPLVLIHQQFPTSILYGLLLVIIANLLGTVLHVALSYYVSNLFENKPVSFFSSLVHALSRIIIILEWIFINALVGQFINALRDQKGIIGRIIGALLAGVASLAWGILTFFVLPIIALENLGIIATIKKSKQSMQQTFGQNVGATFALRAASFILFSIASTVIWSIAALLWWMLAPAAPYSAATLETLTFLGTVTLALPFIIVTPLTSAAGTIFRVASYQYANKKPTGPFSAQMIKESFIAKTLS